MKVWDSPVEAEDDEDQHKGQRICENPHQVVLCWSLVDREETCEGLEGNFHTQVQTFGGKMVFRLIHQSIFMRTSMLFKISLGPFCYKLHVDMKCLFKFLITLKNMKLC